MLYSMCYLDLREKIERVEWESASDRAALREARAMCALRKSSEREAYASKGILVKIRRGYYTPLIVRNETTDTLLLA